MSAGSSAGFLPGAVTAPVPGCRDDPGPGCRCRSGLAAVCARLSRIGRASHGAGSARAQERISGPGGRSGEYVLLHTLADRLHTPAGLPHTLADQDVNCLASEILRW